MRVRIEREVCTGAGDCARSVPEVFVMADDGLAMVQENGTALGEDTGGFTHWAEVPEDKEAAVVQAAAACPGTCIVTEQSAPEPAMDPDPEPEVSGPPPRSSIPKRIAFRVRRLFS